MIKVGVAIILKDNKILIGKRSNNVPFSGLWEFPGGKLEKNETPQEAIKRELKEELNVDSTINNLLFIYKVEIQQKTYELYCYFTDINEKNLKLSVHDEIKWVKLENVDKYNLLKSNYEILKKIKLTINYK